MMRLTRPSTGPEFHRLVRPAVTASRSCSRPLANEDRPGRPLSRDVADRLWEVVVAGELGEHGGERADVGLRRPGVRGSGPAGPWAAPVRLRSVIRGAG